MPILQSIVSAWFFSKLALFFMIDLVFSDISSLLPRDGTAVGGPVTTQNRKTSNLHLPCSKKSISSFSPAAKKVPLQLICFNLPSDKKRKYEYFSVLLLNVYIKKRFANVCLSDLNSSIKYWPCSYTGVLPMSQTAKEAIA